MAVRAPARAKPRPASRPQLRVVQGKKKRKWSPIPLVVCVVLTVFGVTALHAAMGQEGLRTARLEREVQQESERLTLLRARVAQLSNPRRIADEADRLGLVGDPEAVYLRVPAGGEGPSRPSVAVGDGGP